MIDIFTDYFLQREELLARIAQELQLDQTRLERMETAYKAVADLLKGDIDFFKGLEIELYSHGSKRIGTSVKPINNDDFDLDTILHIYDLFTNHSPLKVYNALVRALEKDGYYSTIMEKKKRCVRLNYKSDFHMDILPACMPSIYDKENIKIPEKAMSGWSSGNPKGFANWFLSISDLVKESTLRRFSSRLVEAKIDQEPLPNELYAKTPLQRAVQLTKRYRDIYFQNRDYRVSSIVITTLMASVYQSEDSIFATIDNALSRIKDQYSKAVSNRIKFKIVNPVNPNEDFTDSWTNAHYEAFFSFINDLYNKWQKLKSSFATSGEDYIKLFGEGVYKKTLNDQIRAFSKNSSDALSRSSGLILGQSAHTDSRGNINPSYGTKNESHHNFGGKY